MVEVVLKTEKISVPVAQDAEVGLKLIQRTLFGAKCHLLNKSKTVSIAYMYVYAMD